MAKKSILFVDDEINVIQGLRRMLRSMSSKWDMFFAPGGPEALAMMEKQKIDVVVSDMRMPIMNGAQLLTRVQSQHPNAVRIILSGHSDQELALTSVSTAHQFLAKPCSAEKLIQTVERALQVQSMLTNDAIIRVVTGLKGLPAVPALYFALVKELESEDASLKRAGDILAQDVAMTVRLLHLVNSAFFGLPRDIRTPHQAATLLGVSMLKSLVLYVKVFGTEGSAEHPDAPMEELRRHSLGIGNLTKRIAQDLGGTREQVETAVLSGMLHDVGKLVLCNISGHFKRTRELAKEQGVAMIDAERQILGTTHGEIGAYLLGIWGIPQRIVENVAFHHIPSSLQGPASLVLFALHCANHLWGGCFSADPPAPASALELGYLALPDINARWERWQTYAEEVKQSEFPL